MMSANHAEQVSASARRPNIGIPAAVRTRLAGVRLPLPVYLYLFAVIVPIGFRAGPLLLTTSRLLLLALIVPMAVRLLSGKLGRIYAVDILFTIHVLWMAVALAVNNPDRVVEQSGSVGLEFLGGYLLGRVYIRAPEDFIALCRALLVIVCLSFPLALFETLTGRPFLLELIRMIPSVSTVAFVYADPRMGLERVQMGFAHPIHYGLFCSVVFSLTFVALEGMMGTLRRLALTALVGFCGFLALSSGALLALALQIGLIAWSLVFAKVRARWWILVGLFAVLYVAIDLLSSRSPMRVFMSYATFSAHTAYWRSIIFDWGMRNVWANPLFGLGLNDWIRPSYMVSGSMDNFWLLTAVRYGIPGFLLLATGYALSLFRVMRRDFSADASLTALRRGWVFSFVGLTFTLCTVHVWGSLYSFVFFMFGAGIWLIHAKSNEAEESVPEPFLRPAYSYTRFPQVDRGSLSISPTRRVTVR